MRIPHRRNPAKRNKTTEGAWVVYACLVSYMAKHTWAPSLTELAEMSYYSRARIAIYLEWLEVRGYIERGENHEPRTIRLTERSA